MGGRPTIVRPLYLDLRSATALKNSMPGWHQTPFSPQQPQTVPRTGGGVCGMKKNQPLRGAGTMDSVRRFVTIICAREAMCTAERGETRHTQQGNPMEQSVSTGQHTISLARGGYQHILSNRPEGPSCSWQGREEWSPARCLQGTHPTYLLAKPASPLSLLALQRKTELFGCSESLLQVSRLEALRMFSFWHLHP